MQVALSDCDLQIYEADLDNMGFLTKSNFESALCRFICEVKKSKENADFPGKTLYQIACCLQNHLRKNNIDWNVIHGTELMRFNRMLDSVMKERAAQNIGMTVKQAEFISMRFENDLWEHGILGEDTPDKLCSTVLFLLGVNLALRAGDEHYALRHTGCDKTSQFSFEENCMGVRCLVYREDSVSKMNKSSLRDMKKERKVVRIKPCNNMFRCPIRLVEKYINLLPSHGKKPNFYLQSLKITKPSCWYQTTPVGVNTIRKVVGSLLKNAGLDGYFTNHSLYRTCATRLFPSWPKCEVGERNYWPCK